MKKKLSRAAALLLTAVMLIAGIGVLPGQTVEAAEQPTFRVVTSASEVRPGDRIRIEVYLEPGVPVEYFVGNINLDPDVYTIENVPEFGSVALATYAFESQPIITPNTTDQSYSFVIDFDGNTYSNGGLVFAFYATVNENASGSGSIAYEDRGVSYQTEDGTMVEVESGGVNASTEDTNGNIIEEGEVPVIIDLQSVSLDRTSLTMAKGTSDKLTLTATPANALVGKTVAWTSSDESVVTVDNDGNITAVGVGTARVTVSVTETTGGVSTEVGSAYADITVNAPLTGINITSENNLSTIMKGTSLQLTAEFIPEGTTTDTTGLVWSSSDEDIATVDQNGLVTAIEDGTVTIYATVGDIRGEYQITVDDVPLTDININKTETTIHRGSEETLQIAYVPEDTTDDRTVSWTSSDSDVAVVDGNGTVTAVGIGKAIITAKVGNFEEKCVVEVDAPLEGIVPDVQTMELYKGQTDQIGYTFDPEDTTETDKNVTFTSSDPTVATVNADGQVTALKAGNTTITLTGANGITATVQVTVTEIPIDEVALDKANVIIEKNETEILTATIGPENTTDDNKSVTWSSSDPSVAQVSPEVTESGEAVTITAGNQGGRAVITASTANGMTAECVVTVPNHIESISLGEGVTVNKDETDILEVIYNPAEHDDEIESVVWSSSDTEVASVDPQSGMITAHKEGTAQITATVTVMPMGGEQSKQYVTDPATVTVVENHLTEALADTLAFEELESPLLRHQSIDMYEQMNLAQILSENAITDDIVIEWSSSDEEYAVIDQTGRLTGLQAGTVKITAVITATGGDGQTYGPYEVESGEIEIQEIPAESIAFDKIIGEMTVGATETLHILLRPDDTTDVLDDFPGAVWSSSDSAILSVEDGRLTALKPGTATITATIEGFDPISCEILVKAADVGQSGQSGQDNSTAASGSEGEGSVRTSDPANIILYIALLVGAMAAIVIIWRKKIHRVR